MRLLVLLFYNITSQKALIQQDIARWILICAPERDGRSVTENLIWLMHDLREFRNLFFFRVAGCRTLPGRLLFKVLKFAYRPVENLYIRPTDVGPGFFIQHGFATTIGANKIGSNFWVNQQVTIGNQHKGKRPTIGNNVKVYCGAKVLGDITIGDNVTIGANAVVVKDVPPNCTVVGVPAYIIKRDGKKVVEQLA